MSACGTGARLLSAFVDDELVGDERRAFEAHVGACTACRGELGRERELLERLRQGFAAVRAPERLRARVAALASAPPAPARTAAPRLSWVLAATLVMGAGAAWVWTHAPAATPSGEGPAPSEFAALATDTHLRFARGQLPLEIRSSKPDEVARWFEGRVPFHLALPQHPAGGDLSRLVGGRLVAFRGDYAAYLTYRQEGDRPVSLLVASAAQVRPSGGRVVQSGTLTFHVDSLSGLNVISWVDQGLTYALASDGAVRGERSCLVCHAKPEERRHMEGFDSTSS
jgi:anti-sigma factor RsiW